MANTDIIVSELPSASQVNASDLVMLTQPNAQAETGYSTAKATALEVAKKIASGIEYTTDLANFTDKTLTGAINENLDNILDLLPVNSASGSIANFNTSVALPLQSLKASIVATESGSGTKSPTNPYTLGGFSNAVISHSGKNLLKNDIVYYKSNLNILENCFFIKKGSYIASFGSISNATSWRFSIAIKDKNGNNLTTSEYSPATGFANTGDRWRYGTNQTTKSQVFNFAEDCYIRIFFELGDTSSSTVVSNGQLELGSTATAYEPYTATQTTLALGQTVYGGEIVLTKKASGYGVKLRVTHGMKKLSDLVWIGSNGIFENRIATEDLHTGARGSTNYCEIYQSSYSTSSTNMLDKSIQTMGGAGSSNFWVKDTDYTTAEAFSQSLGDYKVAYPLATPIEIDLTDASDIVALVGTNNVWSDTNGETAVQFKQGIQEYIDAKIAEVQALVL